MKHFELFDTHNVNIYYIKNITEHMLYTFNVTNDGLRLTRS